MKLLILYIFGFFLSYFIFKNLLDEKEVTKVECLIAATFWVLIIPLGVIMTIEEIIRQKIKYHKKIWRKKCFGVKKEK